jgi:hypothetical protein
MCGIVSYIGYREAAYYQTYSALNTEDMTVPEWP